MIKLFFLNISLFLFLLISFWKPNSICGQTNRTAEIKLTAPLTIEDVIRITLGHNTNIKLASNNLKLSFARVLSSSSEFDPLLNIGIDYGKNKNPVPFGLDVLLPEQRNTNYSIGLTKKFDWGLLVNPNIQIRQSD